MNMRTLRYGLIIIFSLSLSACGYIKGGIEELIDIPLITEQKSQGAEVISGSSKGERTAGGYYVDTSVGAINGKIKATTPNGYQVYYGVQGVIVSQ